MAQYCTRCKVLHNDDEMCPHYARQLIDHPELLAEAANFTSVAAQYHLVSSQTLDTVAKGINKVTKSNLSYEGTHQLARDIEVFKQLNVDAYCKSGVFSDAQSAQDYYLNATKGQRDYLMKRLNGTAQEVDWLRWKQGKLSSLTRKSELLGAENTNAPGVDGQTINRITGKLINRTTIKAAQNDNGLGTNISDILKALKSGTLDPNDIVVGVDGTKDKLAKALEKNIKKALENGDIDYANKLKHAQQSLNTNVMGNYDNVTKSTKRLTDKIKLGEANTVVTMQEMSKKAFQGAVIGAVVSLSISSITNYLKYRNGEITEDEAFGEIGEETLKGALIGSAMGAITIFLPGGVLGFVAGMAIGIYFNAACTNVLDEIFGKGAYGAILDASGFVLGMTVSLEEQIKKVEQDQQKIETNTQKIAKKTNRIDENFEEFSRLMKG